MGRGCLESVTAVAVVAAEGVTLRFAARGKLSGTKGQTGVRCGFRPAGDGEQGGANL